MTGPQDTSTTLLRRLRDEPRDEAAWQEFVGRYGRLLYGWCRAWGLQEVDAEDVTQAVMVELARQMRTFVYRPDRRFRAWLRTVAHRTWARFLETQRLRTDLARDPEILQRLLSEHGGDDLLHQLEREHEREIFERAVEKVRPRVQAHTWEAFRLTALEGLSGEEAASRLSMNAGAVYVARSKVQKMLREEVQRLEGGD